jgi:hypothetical protein
MAPRFGTDTWTLQVPSGWRAWHDEECSTLVGPGDLGALQVSAASKDSEVLDQDLRDFASKHLAAGAHAEPAEAGDYAGFEIAFRDGDRYWRQWFLRRGRQALFVTYNCALDHRGAEDDAVRQALASLRQAGQDVA